MPHSSAPQPSPSPALQAGQRIHRNLNRRQLVRQCFALPGVAGYGFVGGCDQALLLKAPQAASWSESLGDGLIGLDGPVAADPTLLLALPGAWSRGLVQPVEAPALQALLEAGAAPITLEAWPGIGPGPPAPASALADMLAPYRALLATSDSLQPAAALQLLQLERQQRHQLVGQALQGWGFRRQLGQPAGQGEGATRA
ncbi:MAG: hypothetical protein ACKOCI_07050 [Cyanobium sp.]